MKDLNRLAGMAVGNPSTMTLTGLFSLLALLTVMF